jgi:hypothetical protein
LLIDGRHQLTDNTRIEHRPLVAGISGSRPFFEDLRNCLETDCAATTFYFTKNLADKVRRSRQRELRKADGAVMFQRD